jgi:Fe-S-cluster-containing dehydrogenase component/DMSO reductase anchor subunit
MGRSSFTLDLNRCTGCSACRLACELANEVSPGVHWRSVTTFNEARWSGAAVLSYSLACNHCAAPTCLADCPAGAYEKDAATGAVILHRERCMGCRYCSWVCPYAAPQLDPATGTMEKCTFCLDRQRRGEAPACASACPTGALGFERAAAALASAAWPPGFPDTGTRPAIHVTARRRGAAPSETSEPHDAVPPLGWARPSLRHGLAAEWPLLAFSFVASVLVAWLAAALIGAAAPPAAAFAGLGAVAMALSALHLGRPARAWRAAFGLRTSWVSREIAAFSVFLGLGTLYLAGVAPARAAGWIAIALGFAALVAMDMVYRARGQEVAAVPHSAMATLTALYLVTVLTGRVDLAMVLALAKTVLYQLRKLRGQGVPSWLVSAARLGVGMLLPLVAWPAGSATLPPLLLVLVLLGELLDRAEFYAELAFLTPRRQAARDLIHAVIARQRGDAARATTSPAP